MALVLRQTWIRAERERRRLVTVTDTMGEGLYVVDRAGRVVMVNVAACRLLGFTEAEVLGQSAHEMFHACGDGDPSPGPLEDCPVHRVQEVGAPCAVSAWFRRKDGVVLAVEITCSLMTGPMSATARSWREGVIGLLLGEGRSRPRDGDPVAVVTFVDVTEQRRHEASLLKLSRAVEQSSASVVITDAQGQIEYVNPAFCQITGYTPEEVLGRTPAMLKSGRVPAEIYRDMWQTIASGREWRGEFHNRRKDGTLYWERATISPIKNEEGKITHFVAVKDDITQKKEIEEELFHRANYDPLTGLPNRQLLLDRLNTALAVARRESHRVAVMFMDLDRFKQVNDTLGHNAGDVLLKQAASRLSAVLRPQDTLGRLGGDEFLVVAPGLHKPSEATVVAGRLLEVARQPFTVDGRDIYVSASIGICLGPGDGTSPQILMRNADAAMYLAKENGRDGFHFFTPEVESASRRRMMIETGLRSAVRDGSLSLLYQPIFAARDGRMTKAEALLRWSHPQLGPVSPAEFIDVAEETGQILALGSWVLEEACRNLANLEVSGGGAFRIAVNISSKQFGQDLSTQIQGLLERHALDPRRLEIEITERVLLHPSTEVLGQLEALRALGVSIAIDDFGTGYSALSYLMAFRIDTLKIDRSFVVAMEKDVRSQALVGAITGMAHDLDARVVAEGVETAEQAALLSSLGVDALQGYLLGRPMPLDSLQSLLFRTGAVALAPL
ncbi:sensor domain-containing protein [Pararhodospirillum photometricum]|uniref:sensor domain-containing protein n=1 Tax=Pararhodospirillum photometricum TaxID=1084 RepID=UPI001F5978DE|nr:bifunctional diguanylate cyclase/phosphodiesterase [Pararhodospirillum photometricum]